MEPRERERCISLYQQLLEAWNRRNADDFAAYFTEDGNTVGFDGSPLDGRPAIASALREIFANHPTATYVAKVREVRRLGPETILLRAVVGMVPPGRTELNPATNAVQSVVIAAVGPEWRISLLHNTPAAFHGRPEQAAALTEELTRVLRSGQRVAVD
jgi:uncharacterized protein (TIGR02246 family)